MKKILAIALATLFAFPSIAGAAIGELKLQANDKGKVILESKKSPDGNEYILHNAEPEKEYEVMTATATTFTTNDYRNGFFDNPHIEYTESIPAGRHMEAWRGMIDNDLNNIVQPRYVTILFSEPLELQGYYYLSAATNRTIVFKLNGAVVHQRTVGNGYYEKHMTIDRMELNCSTSCGAWYSREVEIFPVYNIDYIAVDKLNIDAKDTTASVSYINPASSYWKYNQILLDGEIVNSKTTETTIELTGLELGTEYEVTVRSYYVDGKFIDTIKKFKTAKDTKPPGNVMNLKAVQDGENIKLTYDMPTDKDFSHLQILRNNKVIVNDYKDTVYIDTEPIPNTTNNYRIRSIDKNGNWSLGATIVVVHDVGEVKNLKAIAKDFTNVELIWENTSRSDFEKVTIYRKNEAKSMPIIKKLASFFTSSDDGFEPLFETNGTTFKDLTVAADTEYTYKLTSFIAGQESVGVTTTITTPKLSVVGSEIKPPEEEGEPYVITWQQPNSGKILVKVGGKDYKEVNAADLSISIPQKDMKYDFLGAPDVQLVPIDDNGNPGLVTKPGTPGGVSLGTVKMPDDLTASNVLVMGVALLAFVGSFVLLGLAFRVVPKLINMIRTSYEARGRKA